MIRTPRAVLAALLSVGLAGAVLSPATATAPVVLDLGSLPRGAPPAVPYLEGGNAHVLVDGTLRIPVPDNVIGLVGEVGHDYLVWAFANGRDGKEKIFRISPDGTKQLVLKARALYDAQASPNGSAIATSAIGTTRQTTLKVYDVGTGAVTRKRTMPGYGTVLDFDGNRVAVGVNNPNKTVTWSLATDTVTKVSGGIGYSVDLASNRLARFTKDPYAGGCTVVSTFSDPTTELWTSCRERVEAWSTNGSRIATVDALADGLGPGRAWLRKTGGRLLEAYDAPYFFGRLGFEDATHVLMDTYNRTKYAVVRCDGTTCERASRTGSYDAPLRTARVPVARPS